MATWMIVEDDPDLYEMLDVLTELLGHERIAFRTAEDAVAWINRVDQGIVSSALPTTALLDCRLPAKSGIDVSQRLRLSLTLHNIHIVMMTAYALSLEEEQAVLAQSKADLLLYKPLPNMIRLQHLLRQAVAARNA
jgi:DNA-binding response OmpR family regulator